MLSAKLKAEADDTYQGLDYSGYHKNKSNNLFYYTLSEVIKDKHSIALTLLLEILLCMCNPLISN